ncbi:hypothetical protein [Chiayiivirga flava]|uniref:Right handed beta helix domain-containing protein n=1 Tax=Chiayiivirga flava TaxID=659595 RepID=A0A7W8D623_9GAMM|nr:hypothetical protein [Chiayiivirga flava]MBB5208182.1 hypothetical protein [Chiayiivirga flava]
MPWFPLRHSYALRARTGVALLLLAVAAPAGALTYSVGPGATCTHATLQAAVDAAAANPGPDTVRIVRNATWTAQQISTDTDQDLEIVGGVVACTIVEPDGKTTLSGAGGEARSVIALRGNGVFRLRNLVIRDGDQAGDDDGGGIHFQGGGVVEISDSEIVENSADAGGGIYAHGTSAAAKLVIGANVTVASNTARSDGGGINTLDIETTMVAPGSILLANTAGGSGGGLYFATLERRTTAYIGSTGFADLGAVYGNTAAIGGGIAVSMDPDEYQSATVQIFSTTPDTPVRIAGNHATQRGGAIDLQPRYDPGLTGFPGFPFGTIAILRNADIINNTSPVAAAINLAHDNWGPLGASAIGGLVYFNEDAPGITLHPSAAPCPVGAPCGYIRFNDTVNATGAVVHFSEDANFFGSRIVFEGNRGGWLMYLSGEEATRLNLDNSLITRNTVAHALIRDDQNQDDVNALVNLHHLTIADNIIGANGVLSINEDMVLTRSTIDQPGKALFATDVGSSGGNREIQFSLATTTPTVAGAPYQPPRFVDAANGDYMPRAGAAAVDWAPALEGFEFDLHSRPRPVDLDPNLNAYGPSDIGALERPSLQPLVLNSDFDDDTHLWTAIGEFDWDGTQDALGAPDSGSVRVPMPTEVEGKRAKRVGGLSQCIHVPGPGSYLLNGFGRVLPSSNPPLAANRVSLVWELRSDGGTDGCEDGIPTVGGTHLLADTGAWTRPATPAVIEVPSALWTPNTSITLRFDVAGSSINPPTGWFDAITLEVGGVTSFDGFADGFE